MPKLATYDSTKSPMESLTNGYSTDDEADESVFNNYLAQAKSLSHASISSPVGGLQPSQQYIDGLYEDGKISEKQWHELYLRLGL